MMKVLNNIRILDFGAYITGPFAAMLLADLGADVIKVERPGIGDPFRAFKDGHYSPHFQAHNRNKRSITLDYARPEGLEALKELVRTADVIVINNRPGVAEKLGIDYPSLREINPGLIYCSITGFGPDGPYAERPAFDNVGQALSGWSSRHRRDDDPRVIGPAISDPITSYYAALGVLGALYERAQSGKGHLVEVNMLESTIALGMEPITSYFDTGEQVPVFHRGAMSQAFNVTCKDGKRIGLHLSSPEKFWQALCHTVSREDWIAKYTTRLERAGHYDEISAELKNIFATRNRAEWIPLLERNDVPFGLEHEIQDLESDPQIQHLGVFYEIEHKKYGKVKTSHGPIYIDSNREIDFLPPPDLGEHSEEVLLDAGLTTDRISQLRELKIL